MPDDTRVALSVTTAPPCKGITYTRELYWGGGPEPPNRVVASVVLLVGGQQVNVPLSAFGDLSEPFRLSLGVTGPGSFEVVIEGGQTSTAYRSVLGVAQTAGSSEYRLRKRRVSLNEFQSDVWEETVYSWNSSEE